MDSVQKQLEELGLGQNEVKAYLAALELGSATVLQIAAKAAMVRPTAHVAVGGLIKRGLMSSHTRGKKQYFQAERPEILMAIIENEKNRLFKNEEKLKTLLPRLWALISVVGARPEVNYYEDLEGLQTMRAVLFSSNAKDFMVMGSPEKYVEVVGQAAGDFHNYNLQKSSLKIRQIFLYNKKSTAKIKPPIANCKRRFIKVEELESAEIAIFGDYVALLVYLDKPYGFLIKSKEIARLATILFNATWLASKSIPQ